MIFLFDRVLTFKHAILFFILLFLSLNRVIRRGLYRMQTARLLYTMNIIAALSIHHVNRVIPIYWHIKCDRKFVR